MRRRIDFNNLSIIEILVTLNKRYSDLAALRLKDNEGYRELSYINLGRKTADVSYHLKGLGVEKGDRVGILTESRPEWAVAFFSIISCAGITVPLDIKLSESEISFILTDCQAKCLFVSKKMLPLILKIKNKLKNIKHIICFDETEELEIYYIEDFKIPKGEIGYRNITSEDTAVIVYTSGTTGVAKGVELTYGNIIFEVEALDRYIRFDSSDHFISILPLNHMLEMTGGLLAPLYAGACITYCSSIKPPVLIDLMKENKATIMICVPLILKIFYKGIMKKVEKKSSFEKRAFFIMLSLSRMLLNFNIRIGRLLFMQIHKQFGGRLKCFVSGGAPLDPRIEEDFAALGFRILQGYGLTETSPVVAVNTFKENKYTSVGRPLKGIKIKIDAQEDLQEGEILIQGPNVMKGYYNQPDKTKEVIKDGWFHSGDIGRMDNDGFLYITGRMKNMIVLGGGKKVHPEEIEEVLSKSPLIKEICVVGKVAQEGLKAGTEEVFAVIVPEKDNFRNEDKTNETLIKDKIREEINRLEMHLASYKKISDFMLYFDELPKTSTRKIKRKDVLKNIVLPN
jgi:long-chain acyl-CoA synthetase